MLYVTPYVAIAAFLGGLVYKVSRWISAPRTGARLTIHPAPGGFLSRILSTGVELGLFTDLAKVDLKLWAGTWIMHVGLLMALVGHVRLAFDYLAAAGVSPELAHQISAWGGATAGTMFMVPLFYLLARRWGGVVKELSTPEDHFALLLLIFIAITGNHMRFFQHVDLAEMQAYFRGLATFNFAPPPESGGLPFLVHYALVQLLMVYLPFGKISHLIGGALSKLIAKE
ncbi:MAG: respiratory nitrate reductase subunit gamma [Candidatus Korarchaeota archaeon]|nr:respiratory nitrate reductase subunit gamma [Candidatus Korarchaeota archaeon]